MLLELPLAYCILDAKSNEVEHVMIIMILTILNRCSYIENKKEHWYPSPMIILKDMESLHTLRIAVWLQHRINYQDIAERWTRRALLIEECIKIFRELDLEYRFYPVNVNVNSMSTLNYPLVPPHNWPTEGSKEIAHS